MKNELHVNPNNLQNIDLDYTNVKYILHSNLHQDVKRVNDKCRKKKKRKEKPF